LSTSSETAVRERYTAAAQSREDALCCAVEYEAKYLEAIPKEVIERDYGCGNPSRYVRPNETVLDLGSGTGKICFIAAQIVGPKGRVIGVDMTDDMLTLARDNAPVVAKNIGYHNVEFHKGRIQDLALDLEQFDKALADHSLSGLEGYLEAEQIAARLRAESPMIPSNSINVIVSNCVLNLIDNATKQQMFAELYRVLKPGGRAIISDIVSSEDVPETMQQDSELWSGCISGSLREDRFIRAFTSNGFDRVCILNRTEKPWRTVQKIDFRSITIEAVKNDANKKTEANYFMPNININQQSGGCDTGCC
jgi:ubiquinone/menaquinone biosynthesis C-methylase UbiE